MKRIPRTASKILAQVAAPHMAAYTYTGPEGSPEDVSAAEAVAYAQKMGHAVYDLLDGSFAAFCGHSVTMRVMPSGHEQQDRLLRAQASAADFAFERLMLQSDPARVLN